MNERSPRFCSWWNQDWLSQYSIIAFMCTVTSRRVGCGCMVWSFTTLGECGIEFFFRTTFHEDSQFNSVNEE